MKTQYYTATSLDGFIATEDDSLDWLFPLGDINDTSYPDFIIQIGALAMGSATYLWMVRHAQRVSEQTGAAWPYTQPTWVFSRRELPAIAGADVRFVHGDVRPVHAQMVRAAGSKNVWVVGGGDLAGQFFDAGLLDEAIVQVASVTLGKGKQLFPRRVTSPPWKLISVRQVGSGFAELHYELPVRAATLAQAERQRQATSNHMEPSQTVALRSLLETQQVAALATLHNGEPAVSMVPYALLPKGQGFVIHVSRLATHTADMLSNPAVGLLVTAPPSATVPPQALQRASIQGKAQQLAKELPGYSQARALYLSRFPESEEMFSFTDFSLFVIAVRSARFVGGFAQASSVSAEKFADIMGAAP